MKINTTSILSIDKSKKIIFGFTIFDNRRLSSICESIRCKTSINIKGIALALEIFV